ncbi:maleylacetate reductase [Devosia nitrariae]|uniref:Maleylacetate reductase n=1 Tax=Devosia nitrariae TaxID=2071872 RepID=A0ABQ5W5N0_9HYPH|nr:maleylacetate reductase [Devosia nitrariae]GLQ55374.1 maleylacetate reductase [Devosia nitrariae]
MEFVYNANPSRVIFGVGARSKVAEELDRLGIKRAIVLSTPGHALIAGEFAEAIGERAAIVYPGAAQHAPVEVTEAAVQAAASVEADGCLAIGGGSTTGLSKAIALRTDLPQLIVPTTFAGSEMTPIIGETQGGRKMTRTTSRVLPETVIYDPELTRTMPRFISGPSGMNAIAHSVEALYAKDRNPIISMMAQESIAALGRALPVLMDDPRNLGAHTDALYGAWLAGCCLGAVGMAIHHKLCHTLGGTFNLPHADLHALMLPYSAAYNRQAAPEAMARVAAALGAQDGPSALFDLMHKTARYKSFAQLGLTEEDLDKAAELAVRNPYYNPRPVTIDSVRELLQAAYDGARP